MFSIDQTGVSLQHSINRFVVNPVSFPLRAPFGFEGPNVPSKKPNLPRCHATSWAPSFAFNFAF